MMLLERTRLAGAQAPQGGIAWAQALGVGGRVGVPGAVEVQPRQRACQLRQRGGQRGAVQRTAGGRVRGEAAVELGAAAIDSAVDG